MENKIKAQQVRECLFWWRTTTLENARTRDQWKSTGL